MKSLYILCTLLDHFVPASLDWANRTARRGPGGWGGVVWGREARETGFTAVAIMSLVLPKNE